MDLKTNYYTHIYHIFKTLASSALSFTLKVKFSVKNIYNKNCKKLLSTAAIAVNLNNYPHKMYIIPISLY